MLGQCRFPDRQPRPERGPPVTVVPGRGSETGGQAIGTHRTFTAVEPKTLHTGAPPHSAQKLDADHMSVMHICLERSSSGEQDQASVLLQSTAWARLANGHSTSWETTLGCARPERRASAGGRRAIALPPPRVAYPP